MMDNFTIITYAVSTTSDLSEMIPAIAYLLLVKKGQTQYRVLGLFFLISAIIKLLTLLTAELYINNMPLFHLLACLEIVMLFCFYSLLTFKRILIWGAALLFTINVGNSLFIQNIFTFNSFAWAINMLVLLAIALFYLFHLYKKDEDYTPLEKRPDFIITAGWLIYASGSLFTYLLGTEIFSNDAQGFFHNAWIFQCVSNIVKNVIISYGLWLLR